MAEDEILRHFVANCFFPNTPDRIAVAVSGGGDSMALLHLAYDVFHGTETVLEAVTVDHGLRSESADEARAVAAYCEGLGINHETLHWTNWNGKGNVMAEARNARYQLIGDWAVSRHIGVVLLGHTQDDIAETFLMRLARKSGVDGLSAMAPQFERSGVFWARPLWQQNREGLRAYLRRHEVPWFDDPTNEDARFDRIKMRQAISTLADIGIDTEALVHSASAIRSARSALEHYTFEAAHSHTTVDRGDLLIRRKARPPMHPNILERLTIAGLRWVGGSQYPPRWSAMIEMEAGIATSGRHSLAGCIVTQEEDVIRITREANAVRNTRAKTTDVWDGRWVLKGPQEDGLEVRALGEAISQCPDWRDASLPRASLMASPSIWRGDQLIAAPVAEFANGWSAQLVTDFKTFLLSH